MKKHFRWYLLAVVTLSSSQAWSFACRSFRYRNEIEYSGTIKNVGNLCPKGSIDMKMPTTIILSSPGGDIDQIENFWNALREIIEANFKETNARVKFVFKNQCESACIPILSAANKMAEKGMVELIVDKNTVIGFHGCSDHASAEDPGHYSKRGTRRYLKYWLKLGGSRDWIKRNAAFFKSEDLHEMEPLDPRLQGSNLLTYADIKSVNY